MEAFKRNKHSKEECEEKSFKMVDGLSNTFDIIWVSLR